MTGTAEIDRAVDDPVEALLAHGSDTGEHDGPDVQRQLMVFTVGGLPYASPIEDVRSVAPTPRVVPVPGTPAWIPGVVNHDGEIAPVVDLRVLLGGAQDGSQPELLLFAKVEGAPAGVACLVEKLDDIVTVGQQRIGPPLSTLKGPGAALVVGSLELGGRLVSVLQFERLATLAR